MGKNYQTIFIIFFAICAYVSIDHTSVAAGGYDSPPPKRETFESSFNRTYKVVLRFKEPANNFEKSILEKVGPIEYMNFVRTTKRAEWAKDVLGAIKNTAANNPKALLDAINVIKGVLDIQELETPKSISLEDITKFKQSRLNYQGTYVKADPVFYQETPSGLIEVDLKYSGFIAVEKE